MNVEWELSHSNPVRTKLYFVFVTAVVVGGAGSAVSYFRPYVFWVSMPNKLGKDDDVIRDDKDVGVV
jgi:hypothetical protein